MELTKPAAATHSWRLSVIVQCVLTDSIIVSTEEVRLSLIIPFNKSARSCGTDNFVIINGLKAQQAWSTLYS